MKAKNNDATILELKKQIEVKKRALKSKERFQPKTSCILTLFGETFNIHTLSKQQMLLLFGQLKSIQTGISSLGETETVLINGYPLSEWIDDLQSRFFILNRKEEETKLKTLEDKLHNLLSLDKKVELEIESIKTQI